MGFDYYTFACYYLFSPFNLLILLFKEDQILIFINFLILLKVSCCSLSMAYYLKKSHKLPESAILIGSLCYAHFIFITSYIIQLYDWLYDMSFSIFLLFYLQFSFYKRFFYERYSLCTQFLNSSMHILYRLNSFLFIFIRNESSKRKYSNIFLDWIIL